MKSIKGVLLITTVVLASVCIGFFISQRSNVKVAYVRSTELIYSYNGTKAAQAKFSQEQQNLQANLDTLKSGFNRAIASFNQQKEKMSKEAFDAQRQVLASKESQLQQYAQAIAEKSQQQDTEMMQSVLNQINSFTEMYGKEHGYDFILGTTESGSVLYGKESRDITQELIDALNKEYKGE